MFEFMKKVIFFISLGSTTTSSDAQECRCTFDAAGKTVRCVLADCVICGRPKVVSHMIKCDACHRFAHRRCIMGALNTGKWVSDLVVHAPVACGKDRTEFGADAGTQTTVATCEVACGDETTYRDGCSQTTVATCEVACGDDRIYKDGWSQVTVATCHVASGDDKVYVDGYSQHSEALSYVVSDEVTVHVDHQVGVATGHDATEETVAADISSEEKQSQSVLPPATEATVSALTQSANQECLASIESTNTSTLLKTLKYWNLRYSLFSKFDQGIMLDEVSMYSVCPEDLAEHIAKRCAFDTVLDPFCGAGGNAIQLAFTCAHVIAIDSDPNKIMLARRNAMVYGVADRIEFKVGDSYQMAAGLRVDAVVTSLPWGGPGYQKAATFDARDLGNRVTGGMASILQMAHAVAPKVVLRVPKNIDRSQCLNIAANHGFGRIQYESVTIDQKPNCTNLYLTRKDTHAPGSPVETFKEINLKTPTLLGMQKTQRILNIRNNNIKCYTSYIDSVTRFLAA